MYHQLLLLFLVDYHKGYSEVSASVISPKIKALWLTELQVLTLCHPVHIHPIWAVFFHQCQGSARKEDTWPLCRNGAGSLENSLWQSSREKTAWFYNMPFKRPISSLGYKQGLCSSTVCLGSNPTCATY